jgi:hypothetical protein
MYYFVTKYQCINITTTGVKLKQWKDIRRIKTYLMSPFKAQASHVDETLIFKRSKYVNQQIFHVIVYTSN